MTTRPSTGDDPTVSGDGALDLSGRVVVVTGASAGIGAATARLLNAAGAVPVLAARRGDRLRELSAELGNALAVETDVTRAEDIVRLVDQTLARHGRVDGLVNNAGAALHEPLDELDVAEFRRVLDLNVVSVVAVTQGFLPALRTSRGRIVNVSSGTTRMALPGVGGYAATKAAVNMLSAVWRRELAADGVAVSVVLPSMTGTEFGGGRYRAGKEMRPGVVVHSASYAARFIVRALRTGEERVDVPPGPEKPEEVA